jgi:hypothetical protein
MQNHHTPDHDDGLPCLRQTPYLAFVGQSHGRGLVERRSSPWTRDAMMRVISQQL